MSSNKNKYIFSYLTAVLGLVSSLIATGILARIFSVELFLEYILVNRYFGYFVLFVAFGCNISLPILCSKNREKATKYLIASIMILLLNFLILLFSYIIYSLVYSDDAIYILSSTWIFGMALVSATASYLRGINDNVNANYYLLVSKYIPLLIIPSVYYLFEMNLTVNYFFTVLGLLSIFISIFVLLKHLYFKNILNIYVCKAGILSKYLSYTKWKWLDEMLRFGVYFSIVLFVNFKYSSLEAANTSIMLMFVKVSESLLQSTLSIYSSEIASGKSYNTYESIIAALLTPFIIGVFVYFIFYCFGEFIVSTWLGYNYIYLVDDLKIVLSVIGFIFVSSILRAPLDNKYVVSPNILSNILMLTCFIISTCFFEIALSIVFSVITRYLFLFVCVYGKLYFTCKEFRV